MRAYRLEHLSDHDLIVGLDHLVAKERGVTTCVLAHMAEVDARKLYLPAGYASMLLYCVHHLRYSEDAAKRRIQAARVARQFPALFAALEAGQLHLTAIDLIAPYLPRYNSDELIGAAAFKTKLEIQAVIAQRFPSTELLPLAEARPVSNDERAPGHLGNDAIACCEGAPAHPENLEKTDVGGASAHAEKRDDETQSNEGAPAPPRRFPSRSRIKPLAAGRYELHLSISESTYQKLCHARDLLSHAVPNGDLAEVFERLVAAGLARLEKARRAATEKPRRVPRRTSANPRSIPAHVRRAVWEHDGSQCSFVSASGHRCESRRLLELDHIVPVACAGESTVDNLRVRCRAHNQFEAERTFGVQFMKEKRAARRTRAVLRRPQAPTPGERSSTDTATSRA